MPKKQPRRYRHLIQEDRDRMEALLDAEELQKEVAKILKVDASTVSREKKRRLKNGSYDAAAAQVKADAKRRYSKHRGMKVEGDKDLKAYVVRGLRQKRSPDEIAGRMKREKKPFYASKNAIYGWLRTPYGQQYCRYLCTKRYYKKKRKGGKTERAMIPNRIDISLRPAGAANKSRYGHFEGDTIVAPKKAPDTEAVALAADRKSKLLVGGKIPSLSPAHMAKAVKKMQEEVFMGSCTVDNGIENKYHEEWGVDAFFCGAHHPWEKPLIEGSIGLVRRWRFPKGTDWGKVPEKALRDTIAFLNHKYRKSLKYQSAIEVAMAHGSVKKIKKIKPKK